MSENNTTAAPTAQSNDASDPTGALKRSRRQTSFYPSIQNKPSMPFSKSAAKRESVMALGSIEHLQHYFTKAGLTSKRKSQHIKGLVPALGPAIIPTVEVTEETSSRMSFDLPPSPTIPTVQRAPYPNVERVYPQTDPETLKPKLIQDLEDTEKAWALIPEFAKVSSEPKKGPQLLTAANVDNNASDFFEVLPVLQTTTRTIRSVRNYLMSLPDDQFSNTAPEAQQERTPSTLRHPTTPTKRIVSATHIPVPPPPVPFPTVQPPDSHAQIRKAALDVLAMLRLLEESSRIPLSDDAYDSLSVGSGVGEVPLSVSDEHVSPSSASTPPRSGSSTTTQDRGGSLFSGDEEDNDSATSASNSYPGSRRVSMAPRAKPGVATFVPLKGTDQVIQVWADEDDILDFNVDQASSKGKGDAWDQRLVVGGGWLYKHIPLRSLREQREVVAKYLDAVDQVLFGGPNSSHDSPNPSAIPHRRGWLRAKAALPAPSRLRKKGSTIGPASPTGSELGSHFASSAPGSASLRQNPNAPSAFKEPIFTEPESFGQDEGLDDLAEEDEDSEFEDEELPDWARRDTYGDGHLDRLHAILEAHLPPQLLPYLPPYAFPKVDRAPLLARLSDGQLLCYAYNAIVRKSRKQWGFIGTASIHDIISLEEKERAKGAGGKAVGWTFRRAENLRLWAAALKLRYLVSLAPPTTSSSHLAPSPLGSVIRGQGGSGFTNFPNHSQVLAAMGPPAPFDARIIAKQDDDWEKMLDTALERWVDAVVRERRDKSTHG